MSESKLIVGWETTFEEAYELFEKIDTTVYDKGDCEDEEAFLEILSSNKLFDIEKGYWITRGNEYSEDSWEDCKYFVTIINPSTVSLTIKEIVEVINDKHKENEDKIKIISVSLTM